MQRENKEVRSNIMSKIKSSGGKGERLLAKTLWHRGVRYFKNYKKLPGKPDIAITKYKIVVFIDGEFWHGYDWENFKKKKIHTNRDYWIPKLEKNIQRDKKVNKELNRMGYIVIRFWEKREVLADVEKCADVVCKAIESRKPI